MTPLETKRPLQLNDQGQLRHFLSLDGLRRAPPHVRHLLGSEGPEGRGRPQRGVLLVRLFPCPETP